MTIHSERHGSKEAIILHPPLWNFDSVVLTCSQNTISNHVYHNRLSLGGTPLQKAGVGIGKENQNLLALPKWGPTSSVCQIEMSRALLLVAYDAFRDVLTTTTTSS